MRHNVTFRLFIFAVSFRSFSLDGGNEKRFHHTMIRFFNTFSLWVHRFMFLSHSLSICMCVCVCVLKAYTASHTSIVKVSIITIIINIREACADRYVGEYESRLLADGPHPSTFHPHQDNFPFSFLTCSYY